MTKTCLVEARIKLPRSGCCPGLGNTLKTLSRTTQVRDAHRAPQPGPSFYGRHIRQRTFVVGQHIHNELVQWYIPLPGSKLTYTAGGDQYPMQGGDVSFTPTGFYRRSG